MTFHGSDPGGCIHEVQGSVGHSHPWEDRADEGNGTGKDHGRNVHHSFGSGGKDMRILLWFPWWKVKRLHPGHN